MARHGVGGALEVDAGLNLNQNAFRNLREAADKTGFFRERHLICEVYPAKVRREHIDFLGSVGRALVGIGLQSFDNEVLAHVERSYDEARFEETLEQLTGVADVAVEIIMGLPGDTPQNFRASFERARRCRARCASTTAWCCRRRSWCARRPSTASPTIPVSLKMRSCLGWPEAALRAEAEHASSRAALEGGQCGEFFSISRLRGLRRRGAGIVAARMLVEKHIGSLPVLNARKQLVGIIIETDVFKVMAGMARPRQAKKFRRHR